MNKIYIFDIMELSQERRNITIEIDNDSTTSELMEREKQIKQQTEKYDKQIQKMLSLAGCCESKPYKNNIMGECVDMFYDKRFFEKFRCYGCKYI